MKPPPPTLFEEILDLVWPPRCHLCGGAAGRAFTCEDHRLPAGPPGPRCGRCAAALPEVLPHGERCAACRREPPGFAAALALGDYRAQPAVAEWALALKHGGRRDLAWPLGRALGEALRRAQPERDAILVPIPLHPLRRLERGYDQAWLLAQAASETCGLAVLRALERTRATRPQGEPGASSRAANVSGAFAVRRRALRGLAGREVWLVDDVASSGATASEAARELRRNGARRVGLLIAARGGNLGAQGSTLEGPPP